MINKLEPHQIIVVGTNAAGIHSGGAAAQAYRDFGALMGQARGAIGGQSYGIVTLDYQLQKMPIVLIAGEAKLLMSCALANQNREFLLTAVGCGIAGFTVEEIAPLFRNMPGNVVLPSEFKLKGDF